jgi:hypothetical protein
LKVVLTHVLFFTFFALQQGDQIGRIFADWAIVNLGQFFKDGPYFWINFLPRKKSLYEF